MIGVCGVIGYTGTTSGSICRIASATASPPVMTRRSPRSTTSGDIVRLHRDRLDWTHCGTELAPLAEVEVEPRERRAVETDGAVRAVEPAEQAVDAAVELDGGPEPCSPRSG